MRIIIDYGERGEDMEMDENTGIVAPTLLYLSSA